MQNNYPEAENASGVVSAPQNWLPIALALLNVIPHGIILTIILLVDFDSSSVGGGGSAKFWFLCLLDVTLLAALLAALVRAVWRGERVAWGPGLLILLILMEFLFWLDARLTQPYAGSLGEWLRLLTPGEFWETVGVAGWAERVFYWSARLLALAATGMTAGLVFMNGPTRQRLSGSSTGRRASAMASWCLAAALVGAVFVTTGNGEKKESWNPRGYISEWLEMDCRGAAVLAEYDSHGFLGDGESFYALQFEDDSLLHMIENSRRWKPLPLTKTLTGLADRLGYSIEEAKAGRDTLFPPVQNGWYFFMDRQAEGEARFSDARVMSRGSFNVILAMYDEDTATLYFAKWDT